MTLNGRQPGPPPGEPLEHLLAAVERRDEESMRVLFERTYDRLHAVVRAILRDSVEAEDVLVDVYQRVWSTASTYDPARGEVLTWLTVMARARAIDRLRRNRTDATRQAAALELDLLESRTPTPAEVSLGRENDGLLRAALRALPGDQRRPILAVFYGGLTQAEAATAFDQPLGTIKTRIRTGLRHLRRKLTGSQEEGLGR